LEKKRTIHLKEREETVEGLKSQLGETKNTQKRKTQVLRGTTAAAHTNWIIFFRRSNISLQLTPTHTASVKKITFNQDTETL